MNPFPGLDYFEVLWLCWYMHSKNEINCLRLRWYHRKNRLFKKLTADSDIIDSKDLKRLAMYDATITELAKQIASITKVNRSKILELKRKAKFVFSRDVSNFYIALVSNHPEGWNCYGRKNIATLAHQYKLQLAVEAMLKS